METATLKRFAQQARRSLQDQVTSKLKFVLSPESAARREHPVAVQKLEEAIKKDGKPAVIDQVAYTWFNRFCALRFMDANRYNGTNIVSPAEAGQYQPEILAEAKLGHIDDKLVDEKIQLKVNRLLSGADPSRDPQAEAYRLLLVSVCNYWNGAMPFLFQRIDDYTELLLPDDLLSENSILTQTREALTDEACQDVEVIGWLYQFYISEKKDEVMARKSAVPTEDIPAVTQLFTPHWIVRYLVENSLGRLWMLNRPGSKLTQQMDYYIKPEEPESDYLRIDSVEDIKLCDPACGSGHMLTYAFDLLYAMYEEEGYAAPEIPKLILSKNLFGIEIDDRAGELAAFALTMKARAKDRRIFGRDVTPQITVLEDIQFDHAELADYRRHISDNALFTPDFLNLLTQFENAKTIGSLIQPVLLEQKIIALREAILAKEPIGDLYLRDTHLKVLRVLEQGAALTPRYHVVVANPPYLGNKGMNSPLAAWLKDNYEDVKTDLFAAFIIRNAAMSLPKAQLGFMSPFVWMFISSYEKLRSFLINQQSITSLVQLEYSGFDGATVPICTFTVENYYRPQYKGGYIRLSDFRGSENQAPRTREAINNHDCGWFYRASAADFKMIPGSPISYWISKSVRSAYDGPKVSDKYEVKEGLGTRDDSTFLRQFWEIEYKKIRFKQGDHQKWVPVDKAGGFRKWYGAIGDVMNWEDDGKAIRNFSKSCIRNTRFFFRPAIGWGKVGSGITSFRLRNESFAFVDAAPSAFGVGLESLLAQLNSNVMKKLLSVQGGTLNVTVGVASSLPFRNAEVGTVPNDAILLSKDDWDSFETSWHFSSLPLLNLDYGQPTLKAKYQLLRAHWHEMTLEMQRLEKENNRIFIDAYAMQDELTSDVPLNEVTLTSNPHYRYGSGKSEDELEGLLLADTMRDFISYAVGCMFGRYALEEPGLILANQGETLQDYLTRIPEPSFPADEDNVIPVLDGEWFSDDIVDRFKSFLRITFGDESYVENLRFIEAALGTESKPKSIRDYFVKDFYNDHIKRYKKRPIYWMFTSPKGSFNALIYMHRYRPDTVSVVLNNYLREFRTKLVSHKAHLEAVSISAGSSQADKTKALKEIEKIAKAIVELEDYERDVLYPLATEQLAIDLDDGVKVNYLKFGSALKKIPGLEAKED